MYCVECKCECSVVEYDDSFDHAYGTRYLKHFGSDCCDAEVYRHQCEVCNGTGMYDGDVCDTCEGIGLYGIDVDTIDEI
jgi:hypothetical protein